jgi:hypothetical protein
MDRSSGFAFEVDRAKVKPDVDFFQPQAKPRTQQATFRAPKDLKTSIERLAKFWTALEIVRTDDDLAKVSESDVWIRLAEVAAAAAWAEVGGEPKSERELDQLISETVARLKDKAVKPDSTKK